MIDIAPHDLETVKRLISTYFPDVEARVFGSRYKWTAKDYSDLDIVLVGAEKLDWQTLNRLREALAESNVPFRVDVLDWHTISPEFQRVIEQGYEVIQRPGVEAEPKRWGKYKLGDIVDIRHGYAFKGEFFSDEPTNYVLLTPGNFKIGGGFKLDKFKYYKGHVPKEYILKTDDVIVTMTDLSKSGDTLGYSALVPEDSTRKFLHNQRLGLLQFKRDDFDKYFIYWLLRTEPYQTFVVNSASGSTVKHTSPSRIREFEFEAPDLSVQRRIAGILSALDEKIELNRQTNATLEAIAQAIFKEWFVNFNYPGATGELIESELGLIPPDWRITVFGEELNAVRGLSYRGAGLEEGNATPMHNLNSIYEGGGYKFEGIKYYSGDYQERHTVKPGDLIVANTEQGHKYLLIGYPAIVPSLFGEIGIYSHHIYRVRPQAHSYLTPDFLYFLLLQPEIRDQVTGFANGTTVNMLKIEGLQMPRFVLPPDELVISFTEIARSIRLRQEVMIKQSATLAQIRDTLLPKVMRGEVVV